MKLDDKMGYKIGKVLDQHMTAVYWALKNHPDSGPDGLAGCIGHQQEYMKFSFDEETQKFVIKELHPLGVFYASVNENGPALLQQAALEYCAYKDKLRRDLKDNIVGAIMNMMKKDIVPATVFLTEWCKCLRLETYIFGLRVIYMDRELDLDDDTVGLIVSERVYGAAHEFSLIFKEPNIECSEQRSPMSLSLADLTYDDSFEVSRATMKKILEEINSRPQQPNAELVKLLTKLLAYEKNPTDELLHD